MSLLRITNHPFVDIGQYTLAAMVGKPRLEEVTDEDLVEAANLLKQFYCQPQYKAVQNYISIIFTNAHFVQPAKTLDDKEYYADQMLLAFQSNEALSLGFNCTFFPEYPAVMYAHRQHIPLLNGEDVRNFSPIGTRGIPVSGIALLAIHAMPLGCFRYGNYLGFHQMAFEGQPDAAVMGLRLARMAWEKNDRAIQMAAQGDGKINLGRHPKTRFVDELVEAARQLQRGRRTADFNNITGYFFTNYGPAPNIQMYRLDHFVLIFLQVVEVTESAAWQRVVRHGWERPKDATSGGDDKQARHEWRNRVYEALFELPRQARQFIMNHLSHGNWELIEIFLRKVLQMERERIEAYRMLGDQLGEYVLAYEAPSLGFYYQFARAPKYSDLRRVIWRAEERLLKAGEPEPIFTYERFILAFETPSDGYKDWRLGRDLIAIRLREIIFQQRDKFNLTELPDAPESIDEIDETEN